ncbi:Crp/Fnr family transcriptional regulator [Caldimonas sp. KR1-144]|uniref:Crp/Fnr family transcriptional regulator n=1 Tax=Caldimonas sp. KR1-144 TaxID=3400911 RepID=UPI003C2BF689
MLRRNDVLAAQGRTAGVLRVVKMGTVFAYRRGLDGRSRPVGVVSRGSALGTFGIFNMPNPASCVALTTVRVCEIAIAALHGRADCEQGLHAHASLAILENFAAVTAWSEVMRLPGVVKQLAYVVVLLADAQRVPVVELPSHSALSELLGARRETIARALATLEGEGGIRRDRRRCEVRRDKLLARVTQASG